MKKKTFYLFVPLMFQTIILFGQRQKIIFPAIVENINKNIDYFSPNDILYIGDTIFIEVTYNQNNSSFFPLGEENNFIIKIKKLSIIGMNPGFSLDINDNILSKENKPQDEIKFYSSLSKLTVRDTTYMTTMMNFAVFDTSAQSFSGKPTILPKLDKFFGYLSFTYDFSSINTQYKYYRAISFTATIIGVKSTIVIPSGNEENLPSQSFSLTPNPSTTGLFQIETSLDASKVNVYNAQGSSVVPIIINEHTLDLSAFPKGMYVVVATVNRAKVTKKIIVD